MAILAAVGKTLVGLEELDAAAEDPGLVEFLESPEPDPGFELDVGDSTMLAGTELVETHDAVSTTVPFEGVGIGKPLTLMLEQVYIGDYPDTMQWVPGAQRGDVVVTSANKKLSSFDAAPRAIHLLEAGADRRSKLRAKATHQGSPLVYYSPAVTDDSLLFTFEMSVDREVDQKVGSDLGAAFTAAGALPVFAPSAPFLIAAGIAIPIATKAIGLLAAPSTFFEATHELAFDRPGLRTFQAGAFVSLPEGSEAEFAGYSLDKETYVLRDADGVEYSGPVPYLVISADGTEQEQYKEWAAQAMSAALVDRYFGGAGALTSGLKMVQESLTLFNDVHYQRQAVETKRRADAETDATKKAALLKQYETFKKNVTNPELKGTLA